MMEILFDARKEIFWVGFGILFVSILFHASKKAKPALLFLMVASFLFFLYAAVIIPFLNVWDERFHALVAKNLMQHPLMPTLYNDALLNLPYRWDQAHIWLHKQPLFMWQSALSYKLFGVNELAFRLPGVLLCTFVIYAAYRTGKLLGSNETGYTTAFLIATSLYLEKLISGFAPVDQNDLVFMAYISLSIWAMVEHVYSDKFYWIIITGIFSGCALLTKEAVGLLVYLIWFLYTLQKHKSKRKEYKPILIALIISLVIFIPWQLFIFSRYPFEAKTEYQFNLHHFTQVIDGQGGPFSYHFKYIGLIFGSLAPYLIVPALLVFYWKATDKKLALSIIISLAFVYLFFSLAKTKMQSFTTIAEVPMYLALAFLITALFEWIIGKIKLPVKLNGVAMVIVFVSVAFFRFDFNSLKPDYGFWGQDVECYNRLVKNKKIFQALKLPDNTVICNVPGRHFVEAMFYTKLTAYGFIPSESQYNELVGKGKRIALFMPPDNKLPDYLNNDKSVMLLKDTIEPCE